MTVPEIHQPGTNYESRSGGMGSGNARPPVYSPPGEDTLRIIKSDITGVTSQPAPPPPDAPTADKPLPSNAPPGDPPPAETPAPEA